MAKGELVKPSTNEEVSADRQGLYGNMSAYYSTVKQQEWMTLHLHMLLWLCSSLSLEEARCRIMCLDSSF
ncbi:hypothetical protein J132_00899 [Termitomyces sp. J132]|nr:hypothetical protein J132_00899 [Termitomyces sp. J132]